MLIIPVVSKKLTAVSCHDYLWSNITTGKKYKAILVVTNSTSLQNGKTQLMDFVSSQNLGKIAMYLIHLLTIIPKLAMLTLCVHYGALNST